MQTDRNSVWCEFKILKTSRWRICECAKGNERCLIESRNRISHVCNNSHKGWYYVWNEYCEAIHVAGRSTALDGHDLHHKVFEGHFGLQITPWRQGYYLDMLSQCVLGRRCKWRGMHHGIRVFWLAAKSFCGNAINEPLGAKGPPLVGEEVRKEYVGKVGIS